MGHAAGQPLPADRLQHVPLGHLQEVPAGLSGLWLSLAFAVLMLFAFNLSHVVCLPVCIEAGTYRVVHEWRGCGLLHESVRRTY
jgi:hypothetical protein